LIKTFFFPIFTTTLIHKKMDLIRTTMFCRQVLLLILIFTANNYFSQLPCTTPTVNTTSSITPGAAWQTVVFVSGAVRYIEFTATTGNTYVFTAKTAVGGSCASDEQFSMLTSANVAAGGVYATSFIDVEISSTKETFSWSPSSNGTYRIVMSDYSGADCQALAANYTVGYIVIPATTSYCLWIGGTSTNWNTATNWTRSSASAYPTANKPTATFNVFIPSGSTNQPSINAAVVATCLDLTINSGATVTFASTFVGGGGLTVSGNWTTNGTFNHTGDVFAYKNGSTKTLGGTGTYTNLSIFFETASSTTLSNNITIMEVMMDNSTTAVLNFSSYYLTVTTSFQQDAGTLNFNSGTLEAQCVITNPTATSWNCGTGMFYENLLFSGTWGLTGFTFYDLKINCPGFTYSTGANFTVQRHLTITAGTLAIDSYTLNVGGDFTNTGGTFSSTTGLTNINGSSAQTISGAGTTTFHDLTIANTSGDVALSCNASVTGTLTMTSGDLTIATTKTLTITDVDDPGFSGGSSSSMIVTPGTASVVKNYSSTTPITFPLGTGTIYKPITITPSAVTASNWTVSYRRSPYSDLTVTGGLQRVSNYEYWTVSQSVNLNSTVRLAWVSNDGVSDYTTLQVAKYNGADWAGIASTPSGTNTSGNLPTSAATTIGVATSYFTIGTTSSVNTLPIDLLFFNGHKSGKNNILKWSTASETNNDYFSLEKTTDGTSFSLVGIVNGADNSFQQVDYNFTDFEVRPIINYYRLVQTDFDGKSTASEVISIDNREDVNVQKEIIFKTNILGQEVNDLYKGLVVILYSDGTTIKVIQ
jgi:hypothetical protein